MPATPAEISLKNRAASNISWAASEHDRIHRGLRGGHIGEDGAVHLDEVPENPYRQQAEVDA